MNIGEAADATGISSKMIRYYESIDLIPAAERRDSGYRDYGDDDIHRLRFVRRARELGFSVDRIRGLMSLWSDHGRSNSDVRKIAETHVRELEAQAAKLQGMIATLNHLMSSCRRNERAQCPIIQDLGGGVADAPASRQASRRRR